MALIELLTDELREAMAAHAGAEAPRECCGLLVRCAEEGVLRYKRCRNVFPAPPQGYQRQDRFRMDPEDWVYAEDLGVILAVVHSHPYADANPSMADRIGCEASGVHWLVIGWPSCVIKELAPEGWQAPYLGRDFAHGVLDCYTLIQDWYRRELSIELEHIERGDDWWVPRDGKPGGDLYMRHFERMGFTRVQGVPQRHDVIVMQVRANQGNHGAIYLGEGRILHHLFDRKSCEDVYGGYWQRHTVALLRHRSRWMADAQELAA